MFFRLVTPIRRSDPKQVSRYQHHRPELKADFNNRCGYCDCHDLWKHTFYEVDHFVPYAVFKNLKNIKKSDYSNLVYSCRFCNNSKRNKWPSQDEEIHNNGKLGFIDPCNKEYDTQFYRTNDGKIYWNTELGKWMFTVFKFGERERQIQLIWNLERLITLIRKIKFIQSKLNDDDELYKTIESKLNRYARVYMDLDIQLKEFYS